jgi:hypothetical protein
LTILTKQFSIDLLRGGRERKNKAILHYMQNIIDISSIEYAVLYYYYYYYYYVPILVVRFGTNVLIGMTAIVCDEE